MIAPGIIEFRDAPAPTASRNQVLLRIARIGICGSDIHVYHGLHPYTSYPVVQGHEFSAVIEAVGEDVHDLRPGMKVTAMPQIVCGRCAPCRRGDYHICDVLKVQGFQAPGCAQDLFVTEAGKIVALPENFSFEQGALVEPAAVAAHAVSRGSLIAGEHGLAGKNVVVLGAGPIGNLVAQVARAEGARVLITDLSDYRLQVAAQCGIAHVSNAAHESLRDASRRVFGDAGFDVAWECVGAEPTMGAAVENINKGGVIVVVGVFAKKPNVDLGLIQDRELMMIGTLMYLRRDYDRAVQYIADGVIATSPLDTRHFAFADYLEAYRFIEEQADRAMKVFIDL
jgi:L-iditol 2-dehydrogenase